jgi:hypothetical protein
MRTKPIRRDEIRYQGDIETMPASGMRKGKPIAELWAPLLRSLDQDRKETWQHWVRSGLESADNPPEPLTVPRPYRKRNCLRCGRAFYNADKGPRQNGGVPLYCSDKCVAAVRRDAMVPVVKARSLARAKARAGRKCKTCGKRITAQRSTMRFCSVRCRVAAHRNANG